MYWYAIDETLTVLHLTCVAGCDLYHGKWVYESSGPLYSNNSCPVLTQMQNCQGNGRPDKEYENWRWKPDQCDLPRFDPKKFLELMRGKTLAFIGDSVARNQMESMLCILWQVNRKDHLPYFISKCVTRICEKLPITFLFLLEFDLHLSVLLVSNCRIVLHSCA